jgi:SAM-dependent methyltransferase
MGININDECQDFTGQILRGEKTIETRKTRSLDPYIGERVGLVRTGVGKATLVGYATIGEPVVYDSVAKFRRDYDKHLVAPGSAFDIKDGLKYGYPLMQVEAADPRQVESRGIVARKLNPKNRQTGTPEFERWFGDSKVVDESGEPLVVYHGTSKDKPFSSFTRNAQGTWFTSSPEAASSYAMTNDSQKVVYEGGKYVSKNTSSHVIPVYLSIQNPLMVEGELLEKWRRAVNYRAANKLMVAQAKYAGHDGLVFRDGVFVVFEPTQIKSAIGNKGTFDPEDSNITNPYTRPDLRERLKRKIMAGSKGGNPGQWSARKAQLLAAEYEKAGGGYTGKRSASQRSLSKWTKEDWRTKSGKPSLETGERYLPAAAITALTSAEYAETSRAKRKATGQFSRQPKRIAMKTSEFRNPKDPRSAMTQITGTEDTYINASKMLGGKVLDYGAGRGIGTDALRSNGLLADSFEPFPENWEGKRPPTYTDSANIPSDSYDSLVSFSVINVVDPDERKFLFQEVARILRPDGVALITGRDRQDVQKATTKIPHLEEGGYLIGKGKLQRYQKGFTQAELERYAKEVLGPGFTVEGNRALNGASIKITKGKANPAKRNAVRSKLSRIIEPGDRILCYDTASGEDFYRLWDVIHTAMPMTKEALVEVEGMLDDDGVLVIESGETPAGLQDHFRRATRYNGLLLVQGPKNPEQARIETEKLRRELE